MEGTAAITVADSVYTAAFGYVLTIVVALAAAGMIWIIVQTLEAMKQRQKRAAPPASVSVAVEPDPEPEDETAKHVAAIAAAVYAAIGAHRLVYVGEAAPGTAWRTTGRQLHQTSHMPKRSPER